MTETKWIEFSDTPKIGHGISRGGMIKCANGWIPVSEQLPDDFQMVVVFWYEKGKPMSDVAFWQEDARRFDGEKWVLMKDTVIFWMPLPEKVAKMERGEDE